MDEVKRCVLCADEHWGEHEFFCDRCISKPPKQAAPPQVTHWQSDQKSSASK